MEITPVVQAAVEAGLTLDLSMLEEKPTKPKVVKELPKTMEVPDTSEATLSCVVEGKPKPEVAWYHEQEVIEKSADFVQTYDDTNQASLTIKEVFPDDAGIYTMEAANEAGKVTSTTELFVTEGRLYRYFKLQFGLALIPLFLRSCYFLRRSCKHGCSMSGEQSRCAPF
jgi:hypothetical protein